MWLGPSLLFLLTPIATAITSVCLKFATGWSRWITIIMFALTLFECVFLMIMSGYGLYNEGWGFFPDLFGF